MDTTPPDAALPRLVYRLERGHVRRSNANYVEGSNQIDVYHLPEIIQRHRPFATRDSLCRRDARTVDAKSGWSVFRFGLGDDLFDAFRIRNVTGERDTTDLLRDLRCCVSVEIQQCYFSAA
jgi:hypothetical protein